MSVCKRISTEADGLVGYEMILQLDGRWEYTHRLNVDPTRAADYIDGKLVFCLRRPEHMTVHHIDYDKLNNDIENLVYMTKKEHWRLHSDLGCKNLTKMHQDPVFAAAHSKRASETIARQHKDPEFTKASSEGRRKRYEDLEFARTRSECSSKTMTELQQNPAFAAARDKRAREAYKRMHQDPVFAAARDKRTKKMNSTSVTCPECGCVCGNIGGLGMHRKYAHPSLKHQQ